MKYPKYDLFISYRRTNSRGETIGTHLAGRVFDHLNNRGFKGRVFIDHLGIKNEDFEEKILNSIKNSKVFLLLLTKDTLSRCVDQDDWVRREICQAVESKLQIVVINNNNEFTKNDFPANFPEELKFLRRHQRHTVHADADKFSDDMDRVIELIISPAIKTKKKEERIARRAACYNKLKGVFSLLNKKFWIAIAVTIVVVVAGIPIVNWIKDQNVPFTLEDARVLGSKYYEVGEYDKAIPYLKYAAQKGYGPAQNFLGACYVHGKGVEKEPKKGVKLTLKAAKKGYADAQNNLGYYYHFGLGVPQDDAEAIKWFRKAAEQGDVSAQASLGGTLMSRDSDEAVKWLQKAAEQGDVNSQYNLGLCYSKGVGGASLDEKEAAKWFRKAAEQGDEHAQYNLGVCYTEKSGVGINYVEAVKWFRKSAEQGFAVAQYSLGKCYYYGDGVQQDYANAVEWFRKAAEQGLAKAQNFLGVCYFEGIGVRQDYANAAEWFRKAAWQGLAEAQYNLGFCYSKGHGVSEDIDQAVEWWRKAAKNGNVEAQNALKEQGVEW